MELNQYINKLLEKESFRKEHEKQKLTFEMARQVIHLRISRNKTQKELARLVKTKQPSIARIESGNSLPSLKMLEKIAKALNAKFVPPTFEPLENDTSANSPTITNKSHQENYTQKQQEPYIFIPKGITPTITNQ